MKVDEFRQTVDRYCSTTLFKKTIDSKNLYAMTTLELNYGWHPNEDLFFGNMDVGKIVSVMCQWI